MKAKLIILAFAIFSTSFIIAEPVSHEKTTNCEKKVLNKIHRKMNNLDLSSYMSDGSKVTMIVTCFINDNNILEVAKISSYNSELADAIVKTLKDHPVKCSNQPTDDYFTFKMVLKNMPN